MAAISWKLEGKVSDPCAREMVTCLSSRGWRSTSRTRDPNSGNSSSNEWQNRYLPTIKPIYANHKWEISRRNLRFKLLEPLALVYCSQKPRSSRLLCLIFHWPLIADPTIGHPLAIPALCQPSDRRLVSCHPTPSWSGSQHLCWSNTPISSLVSAMGNQIISGPCA